MERKRPVNLNLFTIKFPRTAIVSILHRVTGLIIFLSLPGLLYILQESLESPDSFEQVRVFLSCFYSKLFLWLVISSVCYHSLAGIRHLLMDMGWGINLPQARNSATLVLLLALIFAVFVGVKLW